jgi:uncharacterized membrane protein (DUF4010 family)
VNAGEIFLELGIALGLGLLVGLQREHAAEDIAGFRTFALTSLMGAVAGVLALSLGGWVVGAGFLAITGLAYVGNLAKIQAGHPDPGLTTEVALLLMFAVGALTTTAPPIIAVAVGGATVALLQWKQAMHGFAHKLGEDDVKAMVQFVLVSFVVLPILPDRAYGPYLVLNPRQIWWMVVLIVAISLSAYIAYRLVGERTGSLVGGALGGMVSSTATTVSYARGAREGEVGLDAARGAILVATAVVYLRVAVEMGVIAPRLLARAAVPLLVMFAVLALGAWWGGRRHDEQESRTPERRNPTELRTAVVFAAIYATVILAVAWAKAHFGNAGLFAVAGVSGLVDLEGITLSSAQLVRGGSLEADLAWRLVLLASLSNLVVKAGIVGVIGGRRLFTPIAVLWAIALVIGLGLVAFWPGAASFAG